MQGSSTASPLSSAVLPPQSRPVLDIEPLDRTKGRFWRLRRRQLVELHAEWARLRFLFIVPFVVTVNLLLLLANYPLWRAVAVMAMSGGMIGLLAYKTFRGADVEFEVRSHWVGLVLGIGGQSAVLAITGGITSPLAPLLLAAPVAVAIIHGKSAESKQAVGATIFSIIGLALLPDAWRGPPVAAPYDVLLSAAALVQATIALASIIALATTAVARAAERLERFREDLVQQSLERTRSLEAVSSKVAHELKNPLAAVKALVQLLSSNAAEERTKQRLEVVRSEIARMEQIMAEYLSFSRPLQDLTRHPVDLAELSDSVIAVLEARAKDAGVSLERQGIPLSVEGDERRLKEALLNLVQNALEATQPGGKVAVKLVHGGDQAEVHVVDTGRGLSAEALQRVGTPFFTTREGGTGLGVVLAKTIVTQHGGQMTFDSREGQGTTVKVRIPYQPQTHADHSIGDAQAVHPPECC